MTQSVLDMVSLLEQADIRANAFGKSLGMEGYWVFGIETPNFGTLYGKWDTEFKEDGKTFCVKIFDFGYRDSTGIEIQNLREGVKNLISECKLKSIITEVFEMQYSGRMKKVNSFTSTKAIYNHTVIFSENWLK